MSRDQQPFLCLPQSPTQAPDCCSEETRSGMAVWRWTWPGKHTKWDERKRASMTIGKSPLNRQESAFSIRCLQVSGFQYNWEQSHWDVKRKPEFSHAKKDTHLLPLRGNSNIKIFETSFPISVLWEKWWKLCLVHRKPSTNVSVTRLCQPGARSPLSSVPGLGISVWLLNTVLKECQGHFTQAPLR